MIATPLQHTYALITGAGDGLGKALALQCASRGYHLLLIDLPGKSLERLAWHLEANYGITVKCLGLDLCAEDSGKVVADYVQQHALPMGILINNAGMGHHNAFDALDPSYVERLVQLNIGAVTRITHALIPVLKEHRGSHIINISSLAAFYTLPFKNIYAASKAYIKSFSLSLRSELKPSGIHVSVVCPAGISSNINQYFMNRNGGWLVRNTVLEPDDVARIILRKALRGHALIIPGRLNQLLFQIVKLIPGFVKTALSVRILKHGGKHHRAKDGDIPGIPI